jgi:transcriptional antiterminator RfaH
MGASMEKWYLVQAKTHGESVAEQNLRRQGYRTFLPQETRQVRHARQTRIRKSALFPGYLFVAFDPERDQWRPIDSTIGVTRLVKRGSRPARVPEGIVEDLQAATRAGETVLADPEITEGDRIRVRRGPFENFHGRILGLRADRRVCILLEAVETGLPVELPAGDVVRAYSRNAAASSAGGF